MEGSFYAALFLCNIRMNNCMIFSLPGILCLFNVKKKNRCVSRVYLHCLLHATRSWSNHTCHLLMVGSFKLKIQHFNRYDRLRLPLITVISKGRECYKLRGWYKLISRRICDNVILLFLFYSECWLYCTVLVIVL